MARRYRVGEGVIEQIVRPGDPLPIGRYVTAWKLDCGQYGKSAIVIHFTPPEEEESDE